MYYQYFLGPGNNLDCSLMSVPAGVVPGPGRRNYDDAADVETDVVVQSESVNFRYDNGRRVQGFRMIKVSTPSACDVDFLGKFREQANLQWEFVPDEFMDRFFETGTTLQCGFRCMSRCNTRRFLTLGFRRHHVPREGDWLFNGPGDLSGEIAATDEKYVVMDQLGYAQTFLKEESENVSGRVGWYIYRPRLREE